jgi:hypothetical protein
MMIRFWGLICLGATAAWAITPEPCSQPAAYYETNRYQVGRIEIVSPFSFVSIVRNQLTRLKNDLPLQEYRPFSVANFNAGFKQLSDAANGNSVFGDSAAKFVWVADYLHDCSDSAKTLNITYRIYSTDPILAFPRTPEARKTLVEQPSTEASRGNTKARFEFEPDAGYDSARRAYGGGQLRSRLPGKIFDSLLISGSGSSTSSVFNAQLHGARTPGYEWLQNIRFDLGFDYSRLPSERLQLERGIADFRFTADSRPVNTKWGSVSLRYGAALDAGNQHAGTSLPTTPASIVTASRYGALRWYGGLTNSTRHSVTALSYAIERGGPGLEHLDFTKQIGDAIYRLRLPGSTHRPMDIEARASAGAILASGSTPAFDRFFGGAGVIPFIPGDSWLIPNGPVVRSIPLNRIAGDGFGGTSFYSGNLTLNKVIFRAPLIPAAINNDPAFDRGINAAEETGENVFADDYETSSQVFKDAATAGANTLTADLQNVRDTIRDFRAQSPLPPDLESSASTVDGFARRSLNTVRNAVTPDSRGQFRSLQIRVVLNPSTSLVRKLLAELPTLETSAPPAFAQRFRAADEALQRDLTTLGAALDEIHNGPVGASARDRAKQDMQRPREAVDTLRNEVNMFSIAAVGLFDAGRLFPDANGTRYAIGGGIRLSVVNVNFTIGVAANPQPDRALGQGPATLFLQLSYTDLFR